MRHLRRLGLLRDKKLRKKGERRARRKSAVDLQALKRAQDAAIAAGERPPTLDDLEDSTEFFTRITSDMYSDEAQEEAFSIMVASAEAPRVNYVKQRLAKFLETHDEELSKRASKRAKGKGGRALGEGKGARAEFVRIAIDEVASKRGIRAWKSVPSGQQTLYQLLEKDQKGLSLWVLELLEATMDHIEGLKWNEVDESVRTLPTVPETQFQAITDAGEAEGEYVGDHTEDISYKFDKFGDALSKVAEAVPMTLETTTEDHIRERYAEALLGILAAEGSEVNENVLNRLDKLAGIA